MDAADLQAAAASLADDPLRVKNPTLWRKNLLDRCIDRELLAAEAVRRGYDKDPAVRRRVADREYATLLGEIFRRVLEPGIEPTPAQLDSLTATGLYRWVDLNYILLRGRTGEDARRMADRLRAGARFDSTARMWSQHPSSDAGGHFGWTLARELNPGSQSALPTAKAGDVLGPFPSPEGLEIYGIGATKDIARDSLYRFVKNERTRGLVQTYDQGLLRTYHFQADTAAVRNLTVRAASEAVASLIASAKASAGRSPDAPWGAFGALARVDGDSVTLADLADARLAEPQEAGMSPLRDSGRVVRLCAAALLPRLVVRDATARGLAREPAVARELKLVREAEATRVMVAHEAGGPPDPAALHAYFASHAARYTRPRATRARAACFESLEVASGAVRAWNGVGISDSALAGLGLKPQPRATSTTLLPRHAAEITVLETDSDPLAVSIRGLNAGQLTPAVRTVQGYAVAQILERRAPGPLSFEEAAPRVGVDYEEEHQALWVERELAKLRATTRIDVVPSRLRAVRLDAGGTKKGTH